MLAYPDLAPADLGTAAWADNRPYLDGRRATVDRLNFGGGGPGPGTSSATACGMERWEMGTITPYLNSCRAPGGAGLADADPDLMG